MSLPPPTTTTPSLAARAARLGVAATVLALVSAAMWLVWLGWDDEYYVVDGVAQGPYRSWQVIGCGVSVAAAAVATYLRVRGVWAVFVLAAAATVGFAVPWTLHAAATDDSGLFVVGLFFLLVGAGAGLTLLLGVTDALTSGNRYASGPPAPASAADTDS